MDCVYEGDQIKWNGAKNAYPLSDVTVTWKCSRKQTCCTAIFIKVYIEAITQYLVLIKWMWNQCCACSAEIPHGCWFKSRLQHVTASSMCLGRQQTTAQDPWDWTLHPQETTKWSSCLQTGPARAITSIWGINQQAEDSLSSPQPP